MLETLENHREKMSVHVNVRMSTIMRTPMKLGVHTYATYANCRTLKLKCYITLLVMLCYVRNASWHLYYGN